MTLLKSANGTLYDVPSDKLKQYEIAPEDVEEMMKASGVQPPPGIQPQQTRPQFNQMRLCLKR
jgi:hypothetical protein